MLSTLSRMCWLVAAYLCKGSSNSITKCKPGWVRTSSEAGACAGVALLLLPVLSTAVRFKRSTNSPLLDQQHGAHGRGNSMSNTMQAPGLNMHDCTVTFAVVEQSLDMMSTRPSSRHSHLP